MTNSELQTNYLRIYRRKLRRELDEMGYGRGNSQSMMVGIQEKPRTVAIWSFAKLTLIVLGLVAVQI